MPVHTLTFHETHYPLPPPGNPNTIQYIIPGRATNVELLKRVKNWQSPSRDPWSNCQISFRETTKGQTNYIPAGKKTIQTRRIIQLHHPKQQTSAGTNSVFSGFAIRPNQMFAARKKHEKPGQQTSGWRQSRCSLDSHYVTNHTLTVREGVISLCRAKSLGAPQTSTLSLCLIEKNWTINERAIGEQFNVVLGTVPRHSIRYHLLSPTFSFSTARRFPNGSTRRAEGTPNSHILFWMKWS